MCLMCSRGSLYKRGRKASAAFSRALDPCSDPSTAKQHQQSECSPCRKHHISLLAYSGLGPQEPSVCRDVKIKCVQRDRADFRESDNISSVPLKSSVNPSNTWPPQQDAVYLIMRESVSDTHSVSSRETTDSFLEPPPDHTHTHIFSYQASENSLFPGEGPAAAPPKPTLSPSSHHRQRGRSFIQLLSPDKEGEKEVGGGGAGEVGGESPRRARPRPRFPMPTSDHPSRREISHHLGSGIMKILGERERERERKRGREHMGRPHWERPGESQPFEVVPVEGINGREEVPSQETLIWTFTGSRRAADRAAGLFALAVPFSYAYTFFRYANLQRLKAIPAGEPWHRTPKGKYVAAAAGGSCSLSRFTGPRAGLVGPGCRPGGCPLRPGSCPLRPGCPLGPGCCPLRPGSCPLRPGPGSCLLRPGSCPLKPGSCPVRPGCPLRPGCCPLRPGSCPLRPGTCPVRPGCPLTPGCCPLRPGSYPLRPGCCPLRPG
ncbi:hypothetical protein FQN60_015248 [Etheostoma spectabile]|uniref:Uncharacterized protein n=1 Tax=Etheostoma spectabile TaxID=54343 RepID=A0A5J5CU48_9PERO|nr:hypothetical protein FQN60_015248 [Etheostoma spectabile]